MKTDDVLQMAIIAGAIHDMGEEGFAKTTDAVSMSHQLSSLSRQMDKILQPLLIKIKKKRDENIAETVGDMHRSNQGT